MRHPARLLIVLLMAAFSVGVIYLFGLQFAGGELYPEYSSLRAGPDGAKLLFESLAQLPGIVTARNYLPLEGLPETAATILLLNLQPETLGDDAKQESLVIERLANRGNRVVIAMHEDPKPDTAKTDEVERRWHVKLGIDPRTHAVHHLYFAEAQGWNALDRAGPKLLAIERNFGKGSVVLISESDDFSNQSTAAADRLDLISAAIGGNSRVVFDESHLGIAESGSIVGLARRFHLTGFAIGLAICAALFIWRNASAFPGGGLQTDPGNTRNRTFRSASQGLITLLRRHIPPAELTAACWREYAATNRHAITPERLRRAEAVVRDMPDRPLDAAREIRIALHSKGSL